MGGLLSKEDSVALGLVDFPVNAVAEDKESSPLSDIKKEFPELFQGLGILKGRGHTIRLKEDVRPFTLYAARQVPIPLQKAVEEKLKEMESAGVIRRIDEPTEWVSPMVVVPKKGGKVRICTDFTKLNAAVRREIHPMATVDHSLCQLSGNSVFSKLDANSGFFQVPLDPESQVLTTFLAPSGRYCYLRLPMGLCSAPEVFQKQMSSVLCGLKGVVVHMDDILIMGKDTTSHDENLQNVLQRLKDAGMTLNAEKCQLRLKSLKFLGRIVDAEGIRPDPEATAAVLALPTPINVKSLKSFLGCVNQYGKFSPHLAEVTEPLRALLKKGTVWMWGPAQQSAFDRTKSELAASPVLAQFELGRPTTVTTDASRSGLGATLSQVQPDGSRRLVAAASRSLTGAESRYACIELECLAIAWALERFATYLTGLTFSLETDHKPLVPILTTKDISSLSPRLQRFRLRLRAFDYEIQHIPGTQNVTADMFSRTPCSEPSDSDLEEVMVCQLFEERVIADLPASGRCLSQLRDSQRHDEVCAKVRKCCVEGWPKYLSSTDTLLRPYWEVQDELTMVDDLLLRGTRIVVPSSERLDILEKIHTGHLGIVKCRARANRSVWWPGMSTLIEEMVNRCSICKELRPLKREPLLPTAWPEHPWEMLGSDLFEYRGNNYLLVVDYHSRYPEIAKLASTSSAVH